MLRRLGLTKVLLQCAIDNKEVVTPCIQFVRWRKRRWDPVNAKKMYHFNDKVFQDKQEYQELKKLNDIHFTYRKSLYLHFKQEREAAEAAKTSLTAMRQEAQELEELKEINRIWNEETAKIREAKQAQVAKELEENRLQLLIEQEQNEREKLKEAEIKVQHAKELAKNFITMDNMEMEIEKALNTRANFNYSIDLQGNKFIEMADGSVKQENEDDEKSKKELSQR